MRTVSLAALLMILLAGIAWLLFSGGEERVDALGREQVAEEVRPDTTTAELTGSDSPTTERVADASSASESREGTSESQRSPTTFEVTGRIVDEHGDPVADATLDFPETSLRATSDARGEVVLCWKDREPPAANTQLRFRARADGFAATHLERWNSGEARLLLGEITLNRAKLLRGRVVTDNGAPVAGALVFASPEPMRDNVAWQLHKQHFGPASVQPGNPAIRALERIGEQIAHTDSAGQFEITDYAVTWTTLFARDRDSEWGFARGVSGSADPTEIVLTKQRPENWIRGQVVDASGNGMPSVELRLEDRDGQTQSGETDREGHFEFWVQAEASWSIRALARRWESEDAVAENVAAGTHDLRLVQDDSEWFWAYVTDSLNRAVTNGRVQGISAVEYEASEGRRQWPTGRVVSELWDDGRARLHLADAPFYLKVTAVGYETKIVGPFVAGHRERVDVRLSVAKAIRGVVTANGIPIEGAEIGLHVHAGEGSDFSQSTWQIGSHSLRFDNAPAAQSLTTTDRKGEFSLPPPLESSEPRRFVLSARAPGWATGFSEAMSEVELLDFETHQISLSGGGRVWGELDLEQPLDLTGWIVLAGNPQGEILSTQVQSENQFSFNHLAAGPWQLRLEVPEHEFSTFTARTDSARKAIDVIVQEGGTVRPKLKIHFPELVTLRGTIQIEKLDPVPWSGQLYKDFGRVFRFQCDETGNFEVQVDEPGEWELRLTCEDSRLAHLRIRDTLQLPAGTTTWHQELELTELLVAASNPEEELRFLSTDSVKLYSVKWESASGASVLANLWVDPEGVRKSYLFPVGTLQFTPTDFFNSDQEAESQTLELRSGEPSEFPPDD